MQLKQGPTAKLWMKEADELVSYVAQLLLHCVSYAQVPSLDRYSR